MIRRYCDRGADQYPLASRLDWDIANNVFEKQVSMCEIDHTRQPPSRRTSISPISKPVTSRSICGASSRISENSSASSPPSHEESSIERKPQRPQLGLR